MTDNCGLMHHDPILEEWMHEFPFILDNAFHWGKEHKFQPKVVFRLMGEFIRTHFQRKISDRKRIETDVLESLLDSIANSFVITEGAIDTMYLDGLNSGLNHEIMVAPTKITWCLRKFGTCLGIRPVDSQGNNHCEGIKTLGEMTKNEGRHVSRFVRRRGVSFRYYGKMVDVAHELESIERYVPDVAWLHEKDAVANALMRNYISTSFPYASKTKGVVVGHYHDIPVYMQVLYGGDTEEVWRRGSVTQEGTTLRFDSTTGFHPYVRYFIQILDESRYGDIAISDVEYEIEQNCQERLIEILLNALVARHLAETISRNPSGIAWRLKKQPV